jgi:hypothetical protein
MHMGQTHLSTPFTEMWLFPRVNPFMYSQSGALYKLLAASFEVANVRTNTAVDPL